MSLRNIISNCRSPKTITLRNGSKITVPCGSCIDCQVNHANRRNALCQKAAKMYPFVWKVDLTYSEPFVPVMRLEEQIDSYGNKYINCIDITARPIKTRGVFGDFTSRFSSFGKCINVINSSFSDPLFKKFYAQTDITGSGRPNFSITASGFPDYYLRYANFKDVQNFIKRLRFHLSQVCDSSISYFAVSEYGPQTFRPHFHLVLFFSDPRIAESLKRCVSKAWQYGNYVCESANNGNALSSYCASYINSFSHLPLFLRGKLVKPRQTHSFRLSEPLCRIVRDFINQDTARAFGKVSVPCGSGVYEYFPTPENIRALYPRTYDYGNKTLYELRELYKIYSKLRRYFKYDKVSEITRDILCYYGTSAIPPSCSYVISRLFRLCHLSTATKIRISENIIDLEKDHNTPWLLLSDNEHYLKLWSDPYTVADIDEYSLRIYSRLYNAIRVSKYFLAFNCEKLSFDDAFERLVAFYKKLPLTRLGSFYRAQQEYIRLTNDKKCDIFYPERSDPDFNYSNVYQGNLFVQRLNENKDLEYSKRVKHKELNDKNLIFCK